MNDSRAIDRESRRRIREELLENILVEAGAPDRARPRCSPSGWRLVWPPGLPGRTHGGRHVHAEGRVGAAGPLPPRARGELVRACAVSPGQPADLRVSRLRSALSNLERFFAGTIHSFCARLCASGRSNRACPRVSPSSTRCRISSCANDLAGFHHERARCRRPRHDRVARKPTSARRIWTRRSRGSARTRMWSFRPGRRARSEAGVEGAETFWQELQKYLPSSIDPDTSAGFSKPSTRFVDSCVCRGTGRASRGRGVVARHVGSRVEDHPEIGGRTRGRKEVCCAIEIPAWRLPHECRPVSRAMASVCVSARDRPVDRSSRIGRVRAPPPELSQLR